jgi:hypothetical protein
MTRFTGLLGAIEEAAGVEAASKLALQLGGTELKISARANGKLARIVGPDAARAIAAALGSERRTIPMAHLRGEKGRRAAAAQMLAGGASERETALAVDVHTRTVRRIRAAVKSGTLPLFDD